MALYITWNPLSHIYKTKIYKNAYFMGASFLDKLIATYHFLIGEAVSPLKAITHPPEAPNGLQDDSLKKEVKLGVLDFIPFLGLGWLFEDISLRNDQTTTAGVAKIILVEALPRLLEIPKKLIALALMIPTFFIMGIANILMMWPKTIKLNEEADNVKIIPVRNPTDKWVKASLTVEREKKLKEVFSSDKDHHLVARLVYAQKQNDEKAQEAMTLDLNSGVDKEAYIGLFNAKASTELEEDIFDDEINLESPKGDIKGVIPLHKENREAIRAMFLTNRFFITQSFEKTGAFSVVKDKLGLEGGESSVNKASYAETQILPKRVEPAEETSSDSDSDSTPIKKLSASIPF